MATLHGRRPQSLRRGKSVFVVLLAAGLLALVVGCGGGRQGASRSGSFRQRLAEAAKIGNPAERAKTLARIGFEQAKAHDELGAEETFQLAERASRQVDDRAERIGALALLIQAQAKSGFQTEAQRLVDQVDGEVKAIDDPAVKAEALGQLSLALDAMGDSARAAVALQEAQQLVSGAQPPDEEILDRLNLLGRIALTARKIGQKDQLAQIIEKMHAWALAQSEPLLRVRLLYSTAAWEQRLGQSAASQDTFKEAEQAVEHINSPYKRAFALAEIAERLSQCKYYSRSHKLLDKAEKIAEQIPERDLRQQALEKVRTLMLQLPKAQ